MKKKKVPKVDPKFLKQVNANQKQRDELHLLTIRLGFLDSMNALYGLYKDNTRYYGKTFNV